MHETQADFFKLVLSHANPPKKNNNNKKDSAVPWTHCITPHSCSLPPSTWSKQTPPQHCQGQDFCLVTALDISACRSSVEVGGRCAYVYRPLMILCWLLLSTFSPLYFNIQSHFIIWLILSKCKCVLLLVIKSLKTAKDVKYCSTKN